MKKLCIALLLPAVLLAACGGKKQPQATRLSGEIAGLGNDTLYVVGMDRLFDRVDTLVVRDGKFADTLSVDTLVGVCLLFRNGAQYPLYADRNQEITLKGSADNLSCFEVTGNALNDEQTAFQRSLDSLGTTRPAALRSKAREFIRQHPSSLVSVYLLDKYFVRVPQPDYALIARLAKPLTGELKDRPYLNDLLTRLENTDELEVRNTLPFFQTTTADGEKLTRSSFKDQLLLINLWASWDGASREANDSLRALYKRQKRNKHFAMLGISLDMDSAQWQQAVRQDTLEWKQACDLAGWESAVAQKFAVRSLPFNVLVDDRGRIVGINLTPAEVEKEIKDFKPAEPPATRRARRR